MEEVVYGRPAAEAVAELVERQGASRVFLMVSGTLNRETDEIEKLRRALGNKCVGTFDRMPAHSPRSAVIAAAEQARAAGADLIVTLGGGSITDAAKAVQLCLSNDVRTPEEMDRIRGQADVTPRSRPPSRPASSPPSPASPTRPPR
jgi:maleylacetate reductase